MTPRTIEPWVYLRSYLAPLELALTSPDITDIYINRPGEMWLETLGGSITRQNVPELDPPVLDRLARQIAALNNQGISREHPLLSGRLPDGSRVQIVGPPATRGDVAIAIRRNVSADLSIDDYDRANAFTGLRGGTQRTASAVDHASAHLERGDFPEALKTAVRGRLNILISGGTSSGKTTFLNALLREIPPRERLISIEDTPELLLRHDNAVGLLASRSAIGEAAVTTNDLVSASLRMRPDRILLGELRGAEAFSFLRAVNTGHPGSMTTIHADSVDGAFEQLALLVLQGGTTLGRNDILEYVRSTVGMSVHLERGSQGRKVKDIRISETPSRETREAARLGAAS